MAIKSLFGKQNGSHKALYPGFSNISITKSYFTSNNKYQNTNKQDQDTSYYSNAYNKRFNPDGSYLRHSIYTVNFKEDEKNGESLLEEAKNYMENDEIIFAQQKLFECIKINPSNYKARFLISEIFETLNKPFLALQHYRHAVATKKYLSVKYHNRKLYNNPIYHSYEASWVNEPVGISNFVGDGLINEFPLFKIIYPVFFFLCFLFISNVFASTESRLPCQQPVVITTDANASSDLQYTATSDLQSETAFKYDSVIILFAQENQEKLDLNLYNPNSELATGHVNIQGQDTIINDTTFYGEKTYVLNTGVGINDNLFGEKTITAYPVPIQNGNLNLQFNNYQNLDGRVEIFNSAGQLLDAANVINDKHLEFNSNIAFIRYTQGNESVTKKIVNPNGTKVQVNVITGDNTSSMTPAPTTKSMSGYTVNFTDPTGNLENFSEIFNVNPGETYTINEVLDWTLKQFFTQGQTSKDATIIYDANGNELTRIETNNGTIPYTTLEERFDQNTGLPITATITAPFADNITLNFIAYKDGTLTIDTLLNRHYNITQEVRNKDANTQVTIYDKDGNILGSGVADETQQIKQRIDELEDAKIVIEAEDAETQEHIGDYTPGNTNLSTVINWHYNKNIENAKPGAQVIGTFNGQEVFNYIAINDTAINFVDTLLNGVLNVQQIKTNAATTNQNFNVEKGSGIITLANMLNQYTANLTGTKEGVNVTWKDTANNTLLTGTEAIQLYQELPNDSTSVKAILSLANHLTKTVDFTNIKPGVTNKEAGQMTGMYTTTITSAKEGVNVTWKDTANNTLLTGTEAVSLYQELAQDSASVKAILSLVNHNDVEINFSNVKPGTTIKDAGQMTGQYTAELENVIAGTNIVWRNKATLDTLHSGIDATQLYKELPQDSASVEAILNHPQYIEQLVNFLNIKPGTTTKQANQIVDTLQNIINYTSNVTQGTAWLVEVGKTDTTLVNVAADGTAQIIYKHIATQPNKNVVIGMRSPNKISQERGLAVSDENSYTEDFQLEDQPVNYTITITGKAINGAATDRIRSTNQAIVIENANGEKFYLDLDANGEFNKDIEVADTTEQVKVYTNATALPAFSNTLSVVKHNEAYPINRFLGSSCDFHEADTASIEAKLLDDDYLRISIVELEYTTNDTILYAFRNGSGMYEPTIQMQPTILTVDEITGTPITALQQQIYEEKLNQAKSYFNLPETGIVIPIANNITTTSTEPTNPEGLQYISQRNGSGYWNGIVQGSQPGYIQASFAQTDANAEQPAYSVLSEIMGWIIKPGPGTSEQTYGFIFQDGTAIVTDTSNKGKFNINFQQNWEPLSGKQE